jgi:DNA-directed RNA polymerase specialized sigma24 family protein
MPSESEQTAHAEPLLHPRAPVLHGPQRVKGRRVEQLLGEWKASEVNRACGTRACRDLDREDVKDIYQDTTEAYLRLEFNDEEHLRNALRAGIKFRALEAHQRRRRRGAIWRRITPAANALAETTQSESAPEVSVLASEDRHLAIEFLAELSGREPQVFWLMTVENYGHVNIAQALNIEPNEARNLMWACETKRERFQTIVNAGRLCGYRAQAIRELESRETDIEGIARRAHVHLQGCARCRKEHSKLASELRHAFDRQIAALMPTPVLKHYLASPALGTRTRGALHALRLHTARIGRPPTERLAALIGTDNGPMASKAATRGAILVLALASGALTATHLTTRAHPNSPPVPLHTDTAVRVTRPQLHLLQGTSLGISPQDARTPRHSAAPLPFGPGHAIAPQGHHRRRAHTTSASPHVVWLLPGTPVRSRQHETQSEIPGGGGEFSP